jgi:phenylpropionate dioxygenase-like ring-hydroxylating dioxygenase large terminal subunit
MPSQETLNPSACVRSFPAVEKHRFVWIWPGDPAKADPALMPDMHWNDDPAWAGDGKMIRVNCDYRLVVDNLMDLTHETFVHGSSIGSAKWPRPPSWPRTATAPPPSRAGWKTSSRRRSGAARSAMRAATRARSTAGRSFASRALAP